MDAELQKEMNKRIKAASTMNEVLDVVNSYYDFDQELGVMSKGTVLMGIQKVIKLCRIAERAEPVMEEE